MTHAEFVKLVRELRQAQKEYTQTRRWNALSKAEDLARQVDREIWNFQNQS